MGRCYVSFHRRSQQEPSERELSDGLTGDLVLRHGLGPEDREGGDGEQREDGLGGHVHGTEYGKEIDALLYAGLAFVMGKLAISVDKAGLF